MLVDPDVLRAFAAQVDAAATMIKGIGLGDVAGSAADGLAGSDTQWAVRQVGRHLGLCATDIVDDVTAMGSAVRGAGDRYEVYDSALSNLFEQLF